jgi:hypothetical protein
VNKRAAAQYLDRIFAGKTGYVAVAYKDRGSSWQECQFEWPQEKAKLLGWAEVHQDANIFVCPALRKGGHTRRKGDMQPSRWLWADVDWQGVPANRVQDVKDRINELSCFTVASGTGDNVHVYVELNQPVDHAQFIKLNTGLRDYLYADSKQADNSLLRLPGTTNWKTDAGSPVKENSQNAHTFAPAALMKRRAFRDAKVITDADALEWSFTEVSDLPRRVKALVTMPVSEAEARYGSRYKAVWAITGELYKRGMGADEIHSLMDKFPAALDKMAEENGYDVHRDVDKRLAYERATANLSEAQSDEIEEEAFELATEEDDAAEYEQRIIRLALAELERSEARDRARMMKAERSWVAPPADTSCSLSELLARPPAPQQFLIDDMCSAEGFVVIVGQYKAGKTKLMVNSLITALADNEPFLGAKQVHVPEGGAIVGHWNLEMSALDLVDKYMRSAEFKNPHNVHLANWQGYGANLLTEPGKQMAIEWLTTRRVQVWTIDSWTALCRSAGVDPNDGGQVGALAQAIIDIKVQAGVQAVFLLAHISRSSQEAEKPGTKGAVDLDAIVDTRWMFTVDKSDVRFIQVEGRGTTMAPTSLDFNEETGRSTLGTMGRGSAAAEGWIQVVTSIVNLYPQGVNEITLYRKMVEKGHPKNKTKAVEHIKEAEVANFIRRERAAAVGRGGRASMMHFPVEVRVDGDRSRQATVREVDLKHVGVRGRRKSTV